MKPIGNKKILKSFMDEHFDLKTLKKAGLIPKEVKLNDYEKIAEIICRRFGYKTIYAYGTEEIRCHITYEQDCRPSFVNEKGEYKQTPFVETLKPWFDEN